MTALAKRGSVGTNKNYTLVFICAKLYAFRGLTHNHRKRETMTSNIFTNKPLITTLHVYGFDTTSPAQRAAHLKLAGELRDTDGRGRWMESHGGDMHCAILGAGAAYDDGPKSAQVELTYMHDNQWTAKRTDGTGKEFRVFDWAQDYNPGGGPKYTRKQGHYLDITPEMIKARETTFKCGYCGHCEPAASATEFCPKCIGSENLEESNLPLTRMRPLSIPFNAPNAPLSETEAAILLPKFRHAQIHGNAERDVARLAKERAGYHAKREKAVQNAEMEAEGMLWLMDRGIRRDNAIFYSHTGKFSFGWRQSLQGEARTAMLEALAEFPFPYDVK